MPALTFVSSCFLVELGARALEQVKAQKEMVLVLVLAQDSNAQVQQQQQQNGEKISAIYSYFRLFY